MASAEQRGWQRLFGACSAPAALAQMSEVYLQVAHWFGCLAAATETGRSAKDS